MAQCPIMKLSCGEVSETIEITEEGIKLLVMECACGLCKGNVILEKGKALNKAKRANLEASLRRVHGDEG